MHCWGNQQTSIKWTSTSFSVDDYSRIWKWTVRFWPCIQFSLLLSCWVVGSNQWMFGNMTTDQSQVLFLTWGSPLTQKHTPFKPSNREFPPNFLCSGLVAFKFPVEKFFHVSILLPPSTLNMHSVQTDTFQAVHWKIDFLMGLLILFLMTAMQQSYTKY